MVGWLKFLLGKAFLPPIPYGRYGPGRQVAYYLRKCEHDWPLNKRRRGQHRAQGNSLTENLRILWLRHKAQSKTTGLS